MRKRWRLNCVTLVEWGVEGDSGKRALWTGGGIVDSDFQHHPVQSRPALVSKWHKRHTPPMFFHVHPPRRHCGKASIQQDQHLNISRPSWVARHAEPPKVLGSFCHPLQYLLRSSKSYTPARMFLGAHQNYKFKVFLRVIELSLAASVHLIDDKVLKLLQLLTLKLILLRQVSRGVVWSQLSCMVLTSSSQDRLNIARKNLRQLGRLLKQRKDVTRCLFSPISPLVPFQSEVYF